MRTDLFASTEIDCFQWNPGPIRNNLGLIISIQLRSSGGIIDELNWMSQGCGCKEWGYIRFGPLGLYESSHWDPFCQESRTATRQHDCLHATGESERKKFDENGWGVLATRSFRAMNRKWASGIPSDDCLTIGNSIFLPGFEPGSHLLFELRFELAIHFCFLEWRPNPLAAHLLLEFGFQLLD